ncbi:hypothetical protein L1H02_004098 [Escherichia coli]|nr:hypothetical protein [Escherichia coli]EIT1425183.1 hypothetical protein [Escherichia coli]
MKKLAIAMVLAGSAINAAHAGISGTLQRVEETLTISEECPVELTVNSIGSMALVEVADQVKIADLAIKSKCDGQKLWIGYGEVDSSEKGLMRNGEHIANLRLNRKGGELDWKTFDGTWGYATKTGLNANEALTLGLELTQYGTGGLPKVGGEWTYAIVGGIWTD